MVVATERSAPVRAVAAGRVIYADWLPGLGLLTIVDHGSGYLSLYGYNEQLRRSAGEAVGGRRCDRGGRRHRRSSGAAAVLRDPPRRQADRPAALVPPAPTLAVRQGAETSVTFAAARHGYAVFPHLTKARTRSRSQSRDCPMLARGNSPMIPDPDTASASDAGADFEAYTQLLRALLPRLTGVSIFNGRGELHLVERHGGQHRAAEADRRVDAHGVRAARCARRAWSTTASRCTSSGCGARARPRRRRRSAAVLLRCKAGLAERTAHRGVRACAGATGARDPAARADGSRTDPHPARLARRAGRRPGHAAVGQRAANNAGDEGGGDELKAILRAAVERIQGGLAAIIVPDKGLVMVRREPKHAIDASLVARAHRHLMSTAQLRPRAGDRQSHGAQGRQRDARLSGAVLSGPARRRARHRRAGAVSRRLTMPEFTPHQARLTELLARRVATVIAHSYDALTGLLTRPAFEQRVRSTLRQRRAARSAGGARCSIDINRMHVINDNYGMHVGDKVIAQLGELIRNRLPPGRARGAHLRRSLCGAAADRAGRCGELRRVAARRAPSSSAPSIGDGTLVVSISVGVAAIEPRAQEFAHAFAAAETACKAANDRGRNRVEVYPGSGREHRPPLHRHQPHHRPARRHRRGPAAAQRAGDRCRSAARSASRTSRCCCA